MSIKRIVVPIDLSEPSMEGLRLGVEWARAFNAEMYLVHVLEVPRGGTPISEAEFIDLIRADAETTLQRLQPTLEGVQTHHIIKQGQPADTIVTCALEVNADAIIMATHGRTGLSRALMGSTTEAVVRTASCPVIVVHRKVPPLPAVTTVAMAQDARL